MKKSFLFTILTTISISLISGSVSAKNLPDINGSISLNDGTNVVRINVGDTSNNDVARRIVMLERAVQQLQIRVYQLEDNTYPRESWMCKVTAFGTTYYGEADTRARAERITSEKCQNNEHAMHCSNIKCERE